MSDQPDAQALLAQARKVLLQELLPLLPKERVYDALMVANAMAIAGREAAGGAAAQAQAEQAIAAFYRSIGRQSKPSAAMAQPAEGTSGGSKQAMDAERKASVAAAETASSPEAGKLPGAPIRSEPAEAILAADIRRGAFAPEHDAALLDLLRSTTRGKLAISNPKHLAS